MPIIIRWLADWLAGWFVCRLSKFINGRRSDYGARGIWGWGHGFETMWWTVRGAIKWLLLMMVSDSGSGGIVLRVWAVAMDLKNKSMEAG